MLSAATFLIVFTIVWLIFPEKAFAWGPATHIQIGLEALKNVNLLGHGLQILLQAYPFDYLYGCIGVDIIFAKGLAKDHEHSHNWDIGFAVLEEAASPAQEAFAYGYLSHLAADAIAHNYFIPECTIKNFKSKTFRHVYWEMRFDSLIKKELWGLARQIVSMPQHAEDDRLLEKVVKRTLFSFKTDRRIFSGLVQLNHLSQWQRMMTSLSERSPLRLPEHDTSRYLDLSIKNSFNLLFHYKKASCLDMDPTGKQSLRSAKGLRKNLRRLGRRGILSPVVYAHLLDSLQLENSSQHLTLLPTSSDSQLTYF